MEKPAKLSAQERLWLAPFRGEDKFAAIAYVRYKQAMGDAGVDQEQARAFMDGFQVGIGCRRAIDGEPPEPTDAA